MGRGAVAQAGESTEVLEPSERLAIGAGDADASHHDEGHAHFGPAKYIVVGVILAVLTGIEIWLSYADMGEGLRTAALLFFMVVKFALVVLYFMHLRFDSPIFRRFFVAGIVLAIFVFTIMLRASHADLGDSVRSETTEEPAPSGDGGEGATTATTAGG
jgi:cytochrome c oxidase subunit IV